MKLSYSHGIASKPLIGETIGDFLDNAAAEFGENEALVSTFENQRYTYREFLGETNRVARPEIAELASHHLSRLPDATRHAELARTSVVGRTDPAQPGSGATGSTPMRRRD